MIEQRILAEMCNTKVSEKGEGEMEIEFRM
jgi:hypothetical protein